MRRLAKNQIVDSKYMMEPKFIVQYSYAIIHKIFPAVAARRVAVPGQGSVLAPRVSSLRAQGSVRDPTVHFHRNLAARPPPSPAIEVGR